MVCDGSAIVGELHIVQLDAPDATDTVPAAHVVQLVAPIPEYVPGEH